MKKTTLRIALGMVLLCIVALSGWATGQAAASTGEDLIPIEMFYMDFRGSGFSSDNVRNTAMWQDMFGLDPIYTFGDNDSTYQKVEVMFAADEYPDVFINGIHYPEQVQKYGIQGYLVPISDYLDKIPNWRARFGDAEWDAVMKTGTLSDGKLYYFPPGSGSGIGLGWNWRKDLFNKLGLDFPKTTDEALESLTKIKEAYPDLIPIPNRGTVDWAFYGWHLAFGVQPYLKGYMSTRDMKYVADGYFSDRWRDEVVFVTKLYERGILDKEFATLTGEQWKQRYAQGYPVLNHEFINRAQSGEDLMKPVVPEADWEYSTEYITAYPGEWHYPKGSPVIDPHRMSQAITDKIMDPPEKFERYMKYVDWIAGPEGSDWYAWGDEGYKHIIQDGKRVPNPDFTAEVAIAEKQMTFEIYMAGTSYSWQEAVGDIYGPHGDAIRALPNFDKYYWFPNPAFRFTEDEQKSLVDLESALQPIFDEYTLKFVFGKLDAANDSDWKGYIDAMNKAGAQEMIKIRNAGFERANQ